MWNLIRGVGGAWEDPPTSKKGTFFLMTLVLSMPIFNKKSHQTKAVEFLKFWAQHRMMIYLLLVKFETFHRSCPMIFC